MAAASVLARLDGRRRRGDAAVYLGLVLGLGWFPASIGYATWAEVRDMRAEWTIAGPPCPEVATPASWAISRHKPPMSHEYGGAVFTRQFGAVSCAGIPERGLLAHGNDYVCQFNNPGALTMTFGGRRVIYQPPVGQRMTVTIHEGRASCVVGGRFNI